MSTIRTTTYGRRKLSAEAYAAQARKKKVTSASGNVYGSRKGGPRGARASTLTTAAAAGRSPAFVELVEGLHDNPIGWAKERIIQLQTPEEVRAIHAIERTNPQHEDGRKGVLNACEERLGELKVPDPSEGLARMPVTPTTAQDEDPADDTEPETPAPDGEEPDDEEPGPFAGDELLEVEEVRAILEEQPELLDAAIDAEFRAGAPREEAVRLFLEREQVRAGGPREEVVSLLEQF